MSFNCLYNKTLALTQKILFWNEKSLSCHQLDLLNFYLKFNNKDKKWIELIEFKSLIHAKY